MLVNGCVFRELTKEPGIVIGDIVKNSASTTITIENNQFIDCQPWDQTGSAERIDRACECDTAKNTFVFTYTNNMVTDE